MDNQGGQVDNRIRDRKSGLYIAMDYLIRVIERKSDQEARIAFSDLTLAEATNIMYHLAWCVEHQDDHNDRSRLRKKRQRSESVSVLEISETSEKTEAETDHSESGASQSSENVRNPVLECLRC